MRWDHTTSAIAISLVCLTAAGCSSSSTQVLVATTPPPAVQRPVVVTTPTVTKGAESGKKQILGSASSIIPDCTSDGYPIVTVVKKPSNGQFDAEKTEAFPSFPKDNVRYSCNSQKVPAIGFYYTSNPGFTGTDSLSLNILYPDGSLKNFSFTILVR